MSDEDFKYLVEEFISENFEPLKQKGAYPYEHMNSFARLKEKKLPARKSLFSITKKGKIHDDGKISDGHISFEYCLTCEKIWDKFDIKDACDFHDHYLKDVLVLADVFEKFIETCLKYYGLDPCHHLSSPGLSWDAMLKMTGIKLEKNIRQWQVLIYWKRTKRMNFLHC